MPDTAVLQDLDEFCDLSYRDESVEWLVHHSRLPKWESRRSDLITATAYDLLATCGIELPTAQIVQTESVQALSLEQRFQEESDKWWKQTAHLSSPAQQMVDPSYQAIMGMGASDPMQVAGLMIKDMQINRRPWFLALSYLTQANPVRSADSGKTDKMIKAWVEWGRMHELL